MNIFNSWVFYVIIYLIFGVIFEQNYRIATKTLTKTGALTVIIDLITGLSILVMVPFFKIIFPSNIEFYILLIVSVIFYAISDRINTTIRSGVEASTFCTLKQLSTVFMTFAGLILFKEPFVATRSIGVILIVFSNFLIFYKKDGSLYNKYILLGLISSLAYTVALVIDADISINFNLPLYISVTFLLSTLLVSTFERIKISEVKREYLNGNRRAIMTTAISWGLMTLAQLRAYQLGSLSKVAPLCALMVILNVIVDYILLKEKDNLVRKIIAALLILISVTLIGI